MKKLYTILVASLLALMIVPGVLAVSVGTGLGLEVITEDFEPLVFLCNSHVLLEDNVETGRFSSPGEEILERKSNYAFEGEQFEVTTLVVDKNKIDQNIDVFATVGDVQGAGNDIEVNCLRAGYLGDQVFDSCNARILEEQLEFDENIMDFFTCTLTVETADSMYGEYWITVEALDGDGLAGTFDENLYFFLNPVVALSIDGDLIFEDVRPGIDSYSETLLVGNDADIGSGVELDMFISGTDFYDSASSGARCPTTNQLALTNFRYYATQGAYSTAGDAAEGTRGPGPARTVDAEGYVNIGYAIGFNDPTPFFEFPGGGDGVGGFEILQAQPVGPYWVANTLAPGAEMALTFKLSLPEPCNGDFDSGEIFFWGEAI
jgi:hypothetical protein